MNACTLTFAVLLLTGAALGDRFGRRHLFTIGVAISTVGSASAALAPSIGVFNLGGHRATADLNHPFELLAAITESGTGEPDVAETLTAVARASDPAEVMQLTAAGTRQVNERRAKAVAVLLEP